MAFAANTILFGLLGLGFGVALPVIVGMLVYRDAKARGMDAILWTIVAVLVPSLVGLIIYLVVRRNYNILCCNSCNSPVKAEHKVCPYCAAPLKYACEQCGAAVEANWRTCPMCGKEQPQGRQALGVRNVENSKTLWVLLIAALGIPVLLMFFVLMLGIMRF